MTRRGLRIAGALLACLTATPALRAEEGPAAPWPRTIALDGNEPVRLRSAPERIVSLSLVSDHLVFELGAGDRVVGATDIAANPAYSFVADAVGKLPPERRFAVSDGAAERVIGLRPVSIFTTPGTNESTVEILRRHGLTVLRLPDVDTIDAVAAQIRAVGRVIDANDRAEALVADMHRRIASVRERVDGRTKPRIIEVSETGQELWAPGSGTLMHAMLEVAGARNAFGDAEGHKPVSMERLLALQPDSIIVSAPGALAEQSLARFRARPGADHLDAVRAGRLHAVPSRLTTTTSHHVVDGIERLAELLHSDGVGGT